MSSKIKTVQCQDECADELKVNEVKDQIDETMTTGVAKIYRALSDPTRLKIAQALNIAEELCVHDVATITESTVATASHHLRLLRDLGLAKFRKEGKLVFYSLDDDHVKQLIDIAFTHQREVKHREKQTR
ncbi:metalloregulator ArsR/SmtB family transcription factor [Sutcliffiella horikoshii]|uniref:ArsR/SmtB family transcription factor n=1 Tax=Sutcliffiella horikoshii TaxID=79883 RepID=UPI00203A6155|nr:metalloregulator ArsR/SmtB family transcription factor [Sutcliffiella horikoshii]MCM3617827.1 metalloregulator ArsR/SmtB family transcription factor [Sutcliffiella horikoshii]